MSSVLTIIPARSAVVNRPSIDDARDSVLEFFAPLSSTSYGVFDSGYKYTYDRFNNEFIYLPLNADIGGEIHAMQSFLPVAISRSLIAFAWVSSIVANPGPMIKKSISNSSLSNNA